jgi:hypothetical protein
VNARARLRTGLDAITNDRVPLREHIARIGHLASETPHQIQALPTTLGAGVNCFAYAFGLFDRPDYIRIATAEQRAGGSRFFANSRFAEHLVSVGAVAPVCGRDVRDGDIALYGDRPRPLHAARIAGDGWLISKWGLGHLYRHRLWEVPARYGHTVRFVRQIGQHAPLREFHAFLKATPEWVDFAQTYLPGTAR